MADHELAEALDRALNSPADLRDTLIVLMQRRDGNLAALLKLIHEAYNEVTQ